MRVNLTDTSCTRAKAFVQHHFWGPELKRPTVSWLERRDNEAASDITEEEKKKAYLAINFPLSILSSFKFLCSESGRRVTPRWEPE